ncbi:hypothetical protein ACFQ3S_17935 [Mucilaginibacter terrae]
MPVPEFANKSVACLLVHNANVYIHLLANFATQLDLAYAEEDSIK